MKILLSILLTANFLTAQSRQISSTGDKCGFDPLAAARTFDVLGHAWGYGYDTLQVDLQRWEESPYVEIDSIGASTQNRGLWLVTITDTTQHLTPPIRISMHARTHPGEVQSTWVTNEVIRILLGESELAKVLRANCIFDIIPMYNPDGVELDFARENANGIDIESNWFVDQPEQEVQVLRHFFENQMRSVNPIEIALNMHSAYACKRYFVFHNAAGTSVEFENLERDFIGKIHRQWPEEFEMWNYFVSWTNGTPLRYPESWFWLNYDVAVMALTYEDKNCESAADFDRVADALLAGIAEYLDLQIAPASVTSNSLSNERAPQMHVFPNPLRAGSAFHVQIEGSEPSGSLVLFDLLGRKSATISKNTGNSSNLFMPQVAAGKYFLRLLIKNKPLVAPITILGR